MANQIRDIQFLARASVQLESIINSIGHIHNIGTELNNLRHGDRLLEMHNNLTTVLENYINRFYPHNVGMPLLNVMNNHINDNEIIYQLRLIRADIGNTFEAIISRNNRNIIITLNDAIQRLNMILFQ